MTLSAPQFGLQSGYCMSGMYRGYRAEATSTTGSTASWASSVSALLGWPLEIIGIGGGINSSLQGVQQHIVVAQALFPYNGSNPQGSHHLAATTTTYQSYWKQTVDALTAQGLNSAQTTIRVAWEGSGKNTWGGIGAFSSSPVIDPSTGVAATRADYAAAFRACVLYMRSVGLSSNVTIEWNVMTHKLGASTDPNGSAGGLDSFYPGDDVVDVVAWDGYAGNNAGAGSVDRTNYQLIYNTDQKPDLDIVTAYARAHRKLAGMSEMGMIQPVPGDTTSNAYVYRPADTALYFQLFSAYFRTNADVWAYAIMFNQNQPYNSAFGTADITEDDQLVYTGTNPATQTYPRIYSTGTSGTSYLTTSTQHTLSGPAYVTYMQSGTMQLLPPPITPTTPTFQIATPKTKPRLNLQLFG